MTFKFEMLQQVVSANGTQGVVVSRHENCAAVHPIAVEVFETATEALEKTVRGQKFAIRDAETGAHFGFRHDVETIDGAEAERAVHDDTAALPGPPEFVPAENSYRIATVIEVEPGHFVATESTWAEHALTAAEAVA
ncbi:MAG: hypothetical protein J2O44_08200 [Porphyrobacter sp.]|nr:hypothetical protein [Porphyrobacter sp.]